MGRVFRNEGISIKHNPEFTLLELYQAYTDYYGVMELIESMMKFCAEKVLGTLKFPYGEREIDFSRPFERITMIEAVKKYAGIDFDEIPDTKAAQDAARERQIEFEPYYVKGDILNLFFEKFVEDNLIQPTFVLDHPIEISPLTKKKRDNPDYAERFELFILGNEFANAYSELNDPNDQRERFNYQEFLREKGNAEANMIDEDFIEALEYGMPPTGGLGFGIDRFVMLLTNSLSIRDVLFFPTMKPL
jgi:lysyl-tRNA synthetase class 2